MKTQVIIVAAGAGSRLKAKLPKALVSLKRNPMVSWSLGVFERCSLIDGIVVVGNKSYLPEFEKIARRFKKVKAVVAGGAKRADSVRLGLEAIDDNTAIVLVHDAARPLIDEASIKRLLASLKSYQAAILAVPVKPTIKKVNEKNMCVEETLARHLLWEVQTPQGFKRDVLIKAHQQKIKEEATDDAMLVERMGVMVKVVMGHERNLKVTTAEDLKIAEGLL
jgi:2-C-methyl-D-erythritol 4-phosphate cytidylyltransferase